MIRICNLQVTIAWFFCNVYFVFKSLNQYWKCFSVSKVAVRKKKSHWSKHFKKHLFLHLNGQYLISRLNIQFQGSNASWQLTKPLAINSMSVLSCSHKLLSIITKLLWTKPQKSWIGHKLKKWMHAKWSVLHDSFENEG